MFNVLYVVHREIYYYTLIIVHLSHINYYCMNIMVLINVELYNLRNACDIY